MEMEKLQRLRDKFDQIEIDRIDTDPPKPQNRISFSQAASDLEHICDTIDNLEDDIGPIIEKLFSERIESFSESVDRRIKYIAYLDSQILLCHENEKDWYLRRQRLQKTLNQIKSRTIETIKANPNLKYKGKLGSFVLRKSASVIIDDISLLPQEFVQIKSETIPLKNDIKQSLKSGKPVSGAKLEERENLQITKKGDL